jgi:hypothetical protein
MNYVNVLFHSVKIDSCCIFGFYRFEDTYGELSSKIIFECVRYDTTRKFDHNKLVEKGISSNKMSILCTTVLKNRKNRGEYQRKRHTCTGIADTELPVLLSIAEVRQHQKFALCIWGCGHWSPIGRSQIFHEAQWCLERPYSCSNGCPIRLPASKWLSMTKHDKLSDDGGALTYAHVHAMVDCPRRYVSCSLGCHKRVPLNMLENHQNTTCAKRSSRTLVCRLGCGAILSCESHNSLMLEGSLLEHEKNVCPLRYIKCPILRCNAKVKSKDLEGHKKNHILELGVITFLRPGLFDYTVPSNCHELQVQLAGGGGGSGHHLGVKGGNGGAGAIIDAFLPVVPGESLQICVGSGGHHGKYSHKGMVGIATGGAPGGGNGHGDHKKWGAGGGGGYSLLQREINGMPFPLIVASGGGGGSTRDGLPGGGIDDLDSTLQRHDWRDGRPGGSDMGGEGGDISGDGHYIQMSKAGIPWKGGAGSSHGGGGGGGMFGGGGGGGGPGIAGGGGGGHSFVNWDYVRDGCDLVRNVEKNERSHKHATLPHILFQKGTNELNSKHCYEGGDANNLTLEHGANGIVIIKLPGFFSL